MNKQYRAILVAKSTKNTGDIVQFMNEYKINDGRGVDNWLPLHLVITSDEQIKKSDWYIDDANKIRQNITTDLDYWALRKAYKKIICSNHTSINNITLSDLKYYIELGCPDMMSLEMEDKVKSRIEHSCKKMRCDCNNKEYCSSNSSKVVDYSIPQLKLIDGHVVFAREKTILEKIDDVSNEQMDEFIEKHGGIDVPDTNVGKMDESELDKAVNKFMDEMPLLNGVYQGTGRFSENSIEDAFYHGAQWQKQQHPKPVEGVMSAEEWLTKNKLEGLSANDILKALTEYAQYVLSMSGKQ